MVPRGAESITGEGHNADDESEEDMLQKAIALSQAGGGSNTVDEDVDMGAADAAGQAGAAGRAIVAGQDGEEDEEMDEDEAIARAIQMSLQEGDGDSK